MNDRIMVTQASLPEFNEYCKMIEPIWKTHWMTNNGEIHQQLEKKLREFWKTDNVELFVNGHLALDIAIKALGLQGEVITTPFTFASTTHALVMNGITPVFCDIKEYDFTIDEDKIESLITDKTSAILAVHVYGQSCNVFKLQQIADKYNLKLIYDAAHAFGVEVNGKPISAYGDISMFSFHATKVFNTIEGGALVFKDTSLRSKLRNLRNFGIEGPEDVVEIGLNAKMNEFCAAMGLCNFQYLSENINKRQIIFDTYRKELEKCPGIRQFKYFENEQLTFIKNFSYYPIIVDEKKYKLNRNELFEKLAKENIFARKYFYPLVVDYACYRDNYADCDLPVARYISDRVLTLPMYADLDISQVKKICRIIFKIYGGDTCD